MAYFYRPKEPEFKPDRTPVRVEITGRVMAYGQHYRPGDVIGLEMHEARYMESLQRCKIIAPMTVEEWEAARAHG